MNIKFYYSDTEESSTKSLQRASRSELELMLSGIQEKKMTINTQQTKLPIEEQIPETLMPTEEKCISHLPQAIMPIEEKSLMHIPKAIVPIEENNFMHISKEMVPIEDKNVINIPKTMVPIEERKKHVVKYARLVKQEEKKAQEVN